jgi:drug/metabolite transporter (DMT)-like permease
MTTSVLLLVAAGLSWTATGIAVGFVERRGFSLVRFQILYCAVCVALGIAGWAVSQDTFLPRSECPPRTWILVISGTFGCGVFNYLMNMAMGRAMRHGPNAIVWAIVQSGLIYPFLMGWLVFGVPMGPRRFCGIALIVASVFLYAAREGAGVSGKGSLHFQLRQWFLPALLGMLCCGIYQCGANLPSYIKGGRDFSGTFRALSLYSGLLLAALVHQAIGRKRSRAREPTRQMEFRTLAALAAFVGSVSFLASKCLSFPGLDRLERLGAGSMGFPIMVASCIIGFFPYGVLVLHERIGAWQILGAILGVIGVLLGCL